MQAPCRFCLIPLDFLPWNYKRLFYSILPLNGLFNEFLNNCLMFDFLCRLHGSRLPFTIQFCVCWDPEHGYRQSGPQSVHFHDRPESASVLSVQGLAVVVRSRSDLILVFSSRTCSYLPPIHLSPASIQDLITLDIIFIGSNQATLKLFTHIVYYSSQSSLHAIRLSIRLIL